MTNNRWEILSGWLSEWLTADANRREDLRAGLAATHPNLVPEAEDLARANGELQRFLDTKGVAWTITLKLQATPAGAPTKRVVVSAGEPDPRKRQRQR